MKKTKEDKIITRKEAKDLNLKTYFTGIPCKRGHISQRAVGSGKCRECSRLEIIKWRNKREEDKYTYTKTAKDTPSQEYLKSIFYYDESTGNLIWKGKSISESKDVKNSKIWNTKFKDKIAGYKNYANDYIEIRLDGQLYKAQRLVWKLCKGEEPSLHIDHINGNPSDNRIENLRLATNQDNCRNMRTRGDKKYRGVNKVRGKYQASFTVRDTVNSSPLFSQIEDAARWYDEQVIKAFGEFAKLNFPHDYVQHTEEF